MSICVSVVVPTYQRSELLNRCLAALVKQNFDSTTYEIIVADDAASEETERLIADWVEKIGRVSSAYKSTPPLRYIAVTATQGPAAARNAGWQAASGEIIAFIDDDCIPDPNWLSAGVAAFTDGVIGVSGRLIVPSPAVPTDYELNAAELEKAEFATANCFYRRDAIAQVGGFDERFTVPWREDSDLFLTLLKQVGTNHGGLLKQAPNAIVVHPIRPAPWGVSLKQQRKSMFNALLYKKHPILYRQKLPPVTPWHYYWMMAALVVAIASLLMHWQTGAIAALTVWATLTVWFCLQRLQHTSHTPQHITEMAVTSVLIPPLSIFWRITGAIKFRVFFL